MDHDTQTHSEHRPGESAAVPVLFVAGTGRSGSTLVSNVLGSVAGLVSLSGWDVDGHLRGQAHLAAREVAREVDPVRREVAERHDRELGLAEQTFAITCPMVASSVFKATARAATSTSESDAPGLP